MNLLTTRRFLPLFITQFLGAFNELKKYEIALENAKARKRAEEDRKETIMLDDIAGQQFLKKMKEEQ